jgi:hypothetical protein
MNVPFDLNVRSLTWNHDSRGLFDYESKNVYKRTFKARPTNESYLVVRNGSEVGMTMNQSLPVNVPSFFQGSVSGEGPVSPLRAPSEADTKAENRPLVRVFYESGRYWIDHPDRGRDPSKSLWRVIRQSKYPCVLSPGDMLKMGRYKIRVREAVPDMTEPHANAKKRFSVVSTDSYDDEGATFASDRDNQGRMSDLSPIDNDITHGLIDIQSSEVCRICYDNGEAGNPLITPCKCAGSMQYVHLKCLRRWMDGRLSVNNAGDASTTTVSYFWRNLDCELCKASYPTSVECPAKGTPTGVETVDLYELPVPESPYIVLESNIRVPPPASTPNAPPTLQKGLHIMSLSKQRPTVLVGRGHDADIRISDISVSRVHAVIKLVQGTTVSGTRKQQIIIEEKGSKFGSLIAVRGPIPLEPGVPVSVQSGRTLTTFTLKKPSLFTNIIPACFGGISSSVPAPATSSVSAAPVLVYESSPAVDLKQVINISTASLSNQPAPPPQRTLVMRASVASTALRRASDALSEEEPNPTVPS